MYDIYNLKYFSAKEASKLLKILLSSKAPMVKKRQVMRNSFGDYRKTMAEEEKQSALGNT